MLAQTSRCQPVCRILAFCIKLAGLAKSNILDFLGMFENVMGNPFSSCQLGRNHTSHEHGGSIANYCAIWLPGPLSPANTYFVEYSGFIPAGLSS